MGHEELLVIRNNAAEKMGVPTLKSFKSDEQAREATIKALVKLGEFEIANC